MRINGLQFALHLPVVFLLAPIALENAHPFFETRVQWGFPGEIRYTIFAGLYVAALRAQLLFYAFFWEVHL